MRSALLWHITQSTLIVQYRRFGTSYRSHLQESRNRRSCCLDLEEVSSWISCPLKMGPICCSETSVRNCHHTLRNSLDESGCQIVFGCVLLTESNVIHFLVPKFYFVPWLLTHWERVTQICVFNTVKHLQVLLSATPQGGMFPEVSHPQALLGSLVSISWKFQFTKNS